MPGSGEAAPRGLELDPRWQARYVIPASTLTGANGLRFGPDGLLYIAQFLSSQVSTLDVKTGAERKLFSGSAGFVAPDDLAFDDDQRLIATEVMSGRVRMRSRHGDLEVLADGIIAANGIVFHEGRLFVDEFRAGGRLLEIYTDGRAPRTILDALPMPNALCVAADGYLYFPAVAAGQVWRVHPDRGGQEMVCGGLAMPTSVKPDPSGNIIVTEAATGRITRIDLVTKKATVVTQLRPGLDNCIYDASGRLFVSHFIDGGIAEILSDGSAREIAAAGLLGPWGLDVDAAGVLYVADGMSLRAVHPRGAMRVEATFATLGFPGFIRNVQAIGQASFLVSTSAGIVAIFRAGQEPRILATGLDQITGLAAAEDGTVLVAEGGTGRVLRISGRQVSVAASALGRPMGIVCEPGGRIVVTDAQGGRVLGIERDGEVRTIKSGLREPHGLIRHDDHYFVMDRGSRCLLRLPMDGAEISTVASGVPVGGGIAQRVLPGSEALPGPLFGISALAARADGTIFVSCDAEGSVLAFSPRMDFARY